MIKTYLQSDSRKSLAFEDGNYGIVTVFEENHPECTKDLFVSKLKKYWAFEKMNDYENLEQNLTRTFESIDRELKKVSREKNQDCTISALTLLFVDRYVLVYCAGYCDLKYLNEYGLRDYGRFKFTGPYGQLELDEQYPDSCIYFKDGTKYLLMTQGVTESLDEDALGYRYDQNSDKTAERIYDKAIREGRSNPSLAIVEYAHS